MANEHLIKYSPLPNITISRNESNINHSYQKKESMNFTIWHEGYGNGSNLNPYYQKKEPKDNNKIDDSIKRLENNNKIDDSIKRLENNNKIDKTQQKVIYNPADNEYISYNNKSETARWKSRGQDALKYNTPSGNFMDTSQFYLSARIPPAFHSSLFQNLAGKQRIETGNETTIRQMALKQVQETTIKETIKDFEYHKNAENNYTGVVLNETWPLGVTLPFKTAFQDIKYAYDSKWLIKIPFQFIENVSFGERAPSYAAQAILSRYEPLQVWMNTSERKVEMEIVYAALDPVLYNEAWVEHMVSLWRALSLPFYGEGSIYHPPPKLYLKVGDLANHVPLIMSNIQRSILNETGISDQNASDTIWVDRDPDSLIQAGHYLPKAQKLNISFITSYSLQSDDKYISFKEVYQRDEGVKRESW